MSRKRTNSYSRRSLRRRITQRLRRLFNRGPLLPPVHLRWPEQLPRVHEPVVGLRRHLDQLDVLCSPTSFTRVVPVVGGPGTGKTTLVSYWAATVNREYSRQVIRLDLSGGQQLEELLKQGLSQLGVPQATLASVPPAELPQFFRTESAGRHLVVIIENAESLEQVVKLLPGHGNDVVVTSAAPLPNLPFQCCRPIELTPLSRGDAKDLLTRLTGQDRLASERAAADALVRWFAGHPLALQIAGRLLAAHPELTIADLVDSLRRPDDAQATSEQKLAQLLDLCCDRLGPHARKTFTLLGAWPGAPLSVEALEAFAGHSEGFGPAVIQKLKDCLLITVDDDGFVHQHATIRAHSEARAEHEEPEELAAAWSRLLRWTIASAGAAGDLLAPGWAGSGIEVDTTDIRPLTFAPDRPRQALAWLKRQLPHALTLMRTLGGTRRGAWKLAVQFLPQLFLDRPQRECLDLALLGVKDANTARDPLGRARCEHILAWVQYALGDGEETVADLERALQRHASIHDDRGHAWTLYTYGEVLSAKGAIDEAHACFNDALGHFRVKGSDFGVAIVLSAKAPLLGRSGRTDEAWQAAEEAVAIAERSGNVPLLGLTHHQLGVLCGRQGNLTGAVRHFGYALEVRRSMGERWGLAETLLQLGKTLGTLGVDYERARAALRESVAVFSDLHHRRAFDAMRALARLDDLFHDGEGR
ncbi:MULTISPECIES: tetratricopeptide repeat protein [Amycolatopsis]|uniref:Tetratricopeptide repeat-containing protein n=2 Tax=Amycolatopsis TaxID=1813 RepID=A0A1I3TVJ4_9PSEU|nr:tetratricopeptide repeat protein [Amycolatopsis sacchari]SFJ74339.1 Tetratricopeptide repeat-containing protein [Amycolatopsis sacchari]